MPSPVDSAPMDQLQRRFDELLAVLAILGTERATAEALHPPELFAALLQGEFDASSCLRLAAEPVQLTLDLHPPGAPPARLHLQLPPAYPGEAPPRVHGVTCDALGRQWEQQAQQALQCLAADASEECVYQLAEALLDMQQQAAAAGAQPEQIQPAAMQQGQQQQQQQQQQVQQQRVAATQQQLALLRLDHMHSRGSYSRLIRRWAAELGLAGRLLFCGASPIILILLKGPAHGLREFLLRMRTRNVDVDSRGRPCRERMMTVLAHTDCGAEGGAAGEASSSTAAVCEGRAAAAGDTCCSTACACRRTCQCDGQAPQLFAAFEEEDVDVAQLAARLGAAGLMQHWGAATGLPPPS